MRASSIKKRVERITREITALQAELDQLSGQASLEGEKHRLIEKYLTPESLLDLKSAVDNLRLFVWKYLEMTTRESGGQAPNLLLQSYRIQRATELLRGLRPPSEPQPENMSFFERIQNIAHVAIEKYESSPEARRRPMR